MTKMHFNALAKALTETKRLAHAHPVNESFPYIYQWEADVRAIASVCRDFNDQFDYDRFLLACGIQ